MSKSKSKGNAFERLVAKIILDAFNSQGFKLLQTDCYRTPGSGGHVFASKQDPSDLVISDRLLYYFPFTVEAKRDESYDISHFFIPLRLHQKSWREKEAVTQVTKANTAFASALKPRYPIVIFQKNRGEVFCVTTVEAHSVLLGGIHVQENILTFNWYNQEWALCLFKPFLYQIVKRAQEI